MVIEDDGRRAGLIIDELLGQQQIVIKPLDESVQGHHGLSGAAVMPDGRVGLILDIGGVIKLAHSGANGKAAPREADERQGDDFAVLDEVPSLQNQEEVTAT